MINKFLRNVFFVLIIVFIFYGSLEIIQRFRHPSVGCRNAYNSLGYRGPNFDSQKNEGLVRIIFLGGSTTFGLYNSYENTIPYLTEKLLNEYFGYRRVETINAAKPGLNSSGILMRLKSSLYLRPDIIIFLEGYNDASKVYDVYIKFSEDGQLIVKAPWYLKINNFLMQHSAFYVTLTEKIAIFLYKDPNLAHISIREYINKNKYINEDWFKYYPRFFRMNLEAIVKIAKDRGAKLIFLNPPLSSIRKKILPVYFKALSVLKKELFETTDKYNIPLIDLSEIENLSEKNPFEFFNVNGLHFTDKANLKIAQIISNFLMENKLCK